MRRCLPVVVLAACAVEPTADLRYAKVTTAVLARVDGDGDGFVSVDEYSRAAFPDEPMGEWDTDADGRLSPSEVEDAFLRADPTRIQAAGRRAVYEKYGEPFGDETEETEAQPGAGSAVGASEGDTLRPGPPSGDGKKRGKRGRRRDP